MELRGGVRNPQQANDSGTRTRGGVVSPTPIGEEFSAWHRARAGALSLTKATPVRLESPGITLGLSSGTGRLLTKPRIFFQVSPASPKAMCRLLQAEVSQRPPFARSSVTECELPSLVRIIEVDFLRIEGVRIVRSTEPPLYRLMLVVSGVAHDSQKIQVSRHSTTVFGRTRARTRFANGVPSLRDPLTNRL